uniref:Myb/SANT-like domain-containing protein n=1 Tax=Setaria italica TaxID=4555 RepID=K4AKZ0_SETIT
MDAGRANWDDNTTKMFLDLCIDEKNKLNYNKKGLTNLGWHNLYTNFKQQTGKKYSCKQLQNKFNAFKRQYKDWRKLKDKSGTGWNNSTCTIDSDDEWWTARIEENEANKHFRGKMFPFYDELTTLFGTTDTEGGPILCVGGIGDRTPSSASEGNPDTAIDENVAWLEDNVGRSSVGRVSQRSGKEHVVDNPPPKRTNSMEYYVERISESMIQRTMNERNLISREEEEVMEMLHLVEQDGVPNGSELYFIATELFRSPARRASYRSITAAKNRIAWLRWTWDNIKRK